MPRLFHNALLLVVLLVAGCTAEQDDVVEIDFWAVGSEGEVVQALITDFEARHPNIKVRVQPLPWTSAHEKLLTAFVGEATPDLCQLGNTWIPEFVALDALEPLDAWIARSPVVHPDDFFSGIWATNVIDSATYGVPWYVDTRLFFYRTDILKEAGFDETPRTWDEWEEALAQVKATVGDDNYAILLPVNEYEQPIILALQQESGMLRANGTYGNFESDDFRKAFTFYIDMFRNGWAPEVSNTQISNVWQEFGRGYFAFYVTGPWNIGEFRRRLPEEVQDHWMTAPLPGPTAGPGTSVAGGASLVMFRRSEHKAATWQLIEYLTLPETQIRFHELLGNLPSRREAWNDPVLAENPYTHAFREQLRHVRPTPQVPEWERIATQIRLHAEEVVYGRLTIDEALASLNRTVDQILEKRRWMLEQQAEAGLEEGP